ncbi:MAG TPA: DPP IV N-terminal domain-containing protein [Chthonomonadaceae bacterium]|nr:DPP IV N-terminal domain-containing protein [Chthonomonadaceae bacterium]
MAEIRRRLLALELLLVGLAPSAACSQGTAADYERADTLAQRVGGKVYRAAVKPNWIDGERFWYRNDLPGGRREFVLVDPASASKKPAFDHARLAEALSKALGRKIEAERLPVERIAFPAGRTEMLAQVGDKTYAVDLPSYAVHEAAEVLGQAKPLAPGEAPDASRSGGAETRLTFVNRTATELSLYWIDTDGHRAPYGTLPAGGRREQHTYAGHVWLVTERDGAPLVAFVAEESPTVAVIESLSPPGDSRPQRPSTASPDGRWGVVVRDYNVFLKDLASGQETGLTSDGSAADRYEGEPVWSPDSRKFVLLKTIPAQEHKLYLVESSPKDQLQPKLHTVDYLKPGDRIAHPRPHLFDIAARKDIPIADSLFPNPWEITDIHWEPDSSRFTFLYNQRGHQVMRLIAVDAQTGEAKTVIEERAKTFIDWTNKVYLHRLDKSHEALWMSERDGWCHLYLYDTRTGQVKNQITQGEWVVRGVDRVDAEKRQVWFRAGGIRPGQDPYYLHFCRVNFDGTGLTVLTEGDGTHATETSPDGKYLVDTYSRVDQPPVSELRYADTGAKVLDLERADATALLKTGWKYPERFTAKGRDGKTDIYGVIWRPMHLDPARKYPVIEQIYAGPQGAFVPKAFASFYPAQSLAELGFIVVQIDGMGTNYRSKAFQDVCWKNLADAGFPDRILWIKAAAAKYPYMDLSRVGIYGTSAGGQSALGGLLLHGDFYKAGVADCGCHDNRMDKIWWNEQWMGWPVGPEYAANSNVALASKLTGKLLLMVGEMDQNVDPSSTMQVVNALINAGKDFELLVMPGKGHGVAGTPYGRRRLQDFFVRHLLGVEPPDRNAGQPSASAGLRPDGKQERSPSSAKPVHGMK